MLRLENVNGMLEVIYDTKMPQQMALATGGTPRLVANGAGAGRPGRERADRAPRRLVVAAEAEAPAPREEEGA